MKEDRPGLDLPPPAERRIHIPDAGTVHRMAKGGAPGPVPAGPRQVPIQQVSPSKPVSAIFTFSPPAGMEHAAPAGVFWADGQQMIFSQNIGLPVLLDPVLVQRIFADMRKAMDAAQAEETPAEEGSNGEAEGDGEDRDDG